MPRFACSVIAFAFVLASVEASAFDGSLEVVSGSGQTAFFGTPFPEPLVARLVDGSGMPIVGVDVTFEVDSCFGFEGSTCPPQSAYPYFGGVLPVVATTDGNGEVTAEPLIAGTEAGPFSVFAWIATDSGFIRAFFTVQQAPAMTTVPITPAFTGAWYDPAQAGHGIFIEVLPSQRLLAYWFAFTPDGTQQAWFGGAGAIAADSAFVEASGATGGRWIPNFDPASYAPRRWGGLTFAFSDCNHGRVWFVSDPYDPAWGTGSMDITRLTQPLGLEGTCP